MLCHGGLRPPRGPDPGDITVIRHLDRTAPVWILVSALLAVFFLVDGVAQTLLVREHEASLRDNISLISDLQSIERDLGAVSTHDQFDSALSSVRARLVRDGSLSEGAAARIGETGLDRVGLSSSAASPVGDRAAALSRSINDTIGILVDEQGRLASAVAMPWNQLLGLSVTGALLALGLSLFLARSRAEVLRRVAMEQAQRSATDDLEIRVKDRTSDLSDANDSLKREVDERRWAEHALRESEDRVRLLLNSTAEAIIGLDPDGRCTFVNQAGLTMFGYDRVADLLGCRLDSVVGGEAPKLAAGIASGRLIEGRHYRLARQDGTPFHAECFQHAIERDGVAIGSVLTFLDVSARVDAESRQADALDKFERIAQSIPDCFWSTGVLEDGSTRVLYASPGFERIWGVPVETLEQDPLTWLRAVVPEDVSVVRHAVGQAISDCMPQVVRYRIHPLGEAAPVEHEGAALSHDQEEGFAAPVRWVEETITPIAGADGRAIRLDGISRDITMRITAERALLESQRTLSTLMSNLPGMAYRCSNDAEWTMHFVSDGCLELTGYQPEQLMASTIISYNDLIHPDDQADVWDDVQAAIRDRRPFRLQYRIRHASGEERWVWEQGRAVIGSDGKVASLEGFITDITTRRRAIEAIQSARDDLETRVSERTVDLLEINRQLADEVETRRRAEDRLRASELRFRDLFDNAHDLIHSCRPDGTFEYANPAWCQTLGYGVEELAEITFFDLLLPGHEEVGKQAFARALAGEIVTDVEIALRTKDGRTVWTEGALGCRIEHGAPVATQSLLRDVTLRREVEGALRETRDRLEHLIATSPAVIYTATADGGFAKTFVSDQIGVLTGTEASSFVDDAELWHERVHPEDRPGVLAGLREPWTSDRRTIEYRFLRADGVYMWARDDMHLIRDPHGHPVEIVGYFSDLTDRRRIEERLRKSEVRYRGIVEDQTEMISRFTGDYRITFVNDSYCRYFQRSQRSLLGSSVLELIPEPRRSDVKRYLESFSPENPVGAMEHEVLLPDGTEVWQQWTDRALFDEEGRIVEFQSVGRDITDRLTAEREASERARQIRVVTDGLPHCVAHVGADLRVLFCNVRYNDWFGVRPEQAVGMDLASLLGSSFLELSEEATARVLQGDRAAVECSVERHGVERAMRAEFIPDHTDTGEVQGFFLVHSDITELKARAEDDQRRLAESAHASRLVTVGEMAAGLAHELNQPLGAISAYARAFFERTDGDLDQERLRLVSNMRQQAQRGGQVIRSIQRLTRKQDVKREAVDLAAVIEEAVDLVDLETRSRGVTVELGLSEELPDVHIDAVQIQQVILNLVRNASEAMALAESPVRRVTIDASAAPGSDGSVVEVRVADTGPGLDPDLGDRIFEPFVTGKDEGVGLGLSICLTIVEDHGGHIWVDRAATQDDAENAQAGVSRDAGPGSGHDQRSGTTFVFSIPTHHRSYEHVVHHAG